MKKNPKPTVVYKQGMPGDEYVDIYKSVGRGDESSLESASIEGGSKSRNLEDEGGVEKGG